MTKEQFIQQFVANYMSNWCLKHGTNPYTTEYSAYKIALKNITKVANTIAIDIWYQMIDLK